MDMVFSFVSYVFGLKFSLIAVLLKRLRLYSKTDLTTNDFFGVSCWILPGFVDFKTAWIKICKKRKIVLVFWHQFFSIVSLSSVLVCSLTVPVLFCHRFFKYQPIGFRIALQVYLLFFCVLQSNSPKIVME